MTQDALHDLLRRLRSRDAVFGHDVEGLPAVVPGGHLLGAEVADLGARRVAADGLLEGEVEGVEAGVVAGSGDPVEHRPVAAGVEDPVKDHVVAAGQAVLSGRLKQVRVSEALLLQLGVDIPSKVVLACLLYTSDAADE